MQNAESKMQNECNWPENSEGKNKIQLGLNVQSCRSCAKMNIGTALYELFKQPSMLYRFDKARGVLQLEEHLLKSAICMVNAFQEDRPLELVSLTEDGFEVTARRVDE